MKHHVPCLGFKLVDAARLVALATLLALAAPVSATQPGSEEHPSWEKSGDLLQWGIPLAGLGLSFLLNPLDAYGTREFDLGSSALGEMPGLNWPGPRLSSTPRHDFLVSFLRVETSTYALKYAINAKRPNGGSQSFPSGHTAASFMGAEFIRKEYGNAWGLPAYTAASWVGYTRVESHNHYWRDVIAGAALGVACNYDFDAIRTPLGVLSVSPAGFIVDPGGLPEHGDALGDRPMDLPLPRPGLRVELKF